MGTKRRSSGKRAGQKRAGARRRSDTKRNPVQGATRAGAREMRPEQSARLVEAEGERAPEERGLHLAAEPESGAEEAGGPTAAAKDADARRRTEAQADLSRRREATVEERPADGAGEFPGLKEIGIELAIGALRLARTIATAPLRLGLALLRSREA